VSAGSAGEPILSITSTTTVRSQAGTLARTSPRRLLFTLVRLAAGLGILIYLSRSGIIDFRSLLRLLTAWPLTLAALAILLTDLTLMAVRISLLFRAQNLQLSVLNALQLTLVGSFFSMFLPGTVGGDLPKLYYAAKGNLGRRTEVATIVLLDRVLGLFSVLLPPLLAAPFFPGLIRSLPILRDLLLIDALLAAGMLAGGALCMYSEAARKFLSHWVLGRTPLKNTAGRVLDTIAGYRHTCGTVLATIGLSFVANLSVIAVTALAILALNPAELRWRMLFVVPMGHIVNSLPLTPGGIGVGETAFNSLFHLAGIQGGAEALLCWRVWNGLIGLLGLSVYVSGLGRVVFDRREDSDFVTSHSAYSAEVDAGPEEPETALVTSSSEARPEASANFGEGQKLWY
jgi:glycosyltransferase 2 family protein